MLDVILTPPAASSTSHETSLLVTWQNPATRAYFLVGRLLHDDAGFTFDYFPGVEQEDGFRPAPGFPDLHRTYHSSVLFPLFSSRLMSTSRPDRAAWLESLGLTDGATEFTILGRSLGHRVGDDFELYPEPHVDFSRKLVSVELPLHGLRYHPDGEEALARNLLSPGDSLLVRREPENSYDPYAQAVFLVDGTQLGYIPAPALRYLKRAGLLNGEPTATVVHVNPAQYGHHQRIILKAQWSY